MNKGMLNRLDLQQISAFILTGGESPPRTETYEQQIEKARELAYSAMEKAIAGTMDKEDAEYALNDTLDIFEEVYTQIGMKLGAKMFVQLLYNDDSFNL